MISQMWQNHKFRKFLAIIVTLATSLTMCAWSINANADFFRDVAPPVYAIGFVVVLLFVWLTWGRGIWNTPGNESNGEASMAGRNIVVRGTVGRSVDHGYEPKGTGSEYYRFIVTNTDEDKQWDCELKARKIIGRVVEDAEVKISGSIANTGQVIAREVIHLKSGAVAKPARDWTILISLFQISLILIFLIFWLFVLPWLMEFFFY